MTYETKEIAVGAWTASVTAEDVANPSGVPTVLVRATVSVAGVPVAAEVLATLGPVDGGMGATPTDYVQRSLDAARNKAAKLAGFRADIQSQLQAAR